MSSVFITTKPEGMSSFPVFQTVCALLLSCDRNFVRECANTVRDIAVFLCKEKILPNCIFEVWLCRVWVEVY